ncbi:MAG TPA: lysylphosphatidylglycerol synthase transmembrane domain-containing protein [Chloroflexota bacterium]|nr:lysylphosphatidylglycerol synthase transmembrane domain-containing protein [Chloroflexota bacterium]
MSDVQAELGTGDVDLEEAGQPMQEPVPLGRRVADWKTIASFGVAIAILVLVMVRAGLNPAQLWSRIHHAAWGYFLLAFVLYYLTFPLRGLRWQMLLQNAYRDSETESVADMHLSGLTEIVFISWFVNCVVPAKLGDLYRAYLAKLWQHISWVKTIGTIVAERMVDILAVAVLLGASGLIAFHGRLGSIKYILGLGLLLAMLGIVALVLMKRFSPLIRRYVPARFEQRYGAFEEGTLLSLRRLPLVFGVTLPIWLLEGLRLYFVFASLHIGVSTITTVPYAAMLFFALGTAVLTTIPLTPGGLGIVQGGLLGVMVLLGLSRNDSADVVLMDSLLSYYSIAIFGFIVYLVSKRSHFRHV